MPWRRLETLMRESKACLAGGINFTQKADMLHTCILDRTSNNYLVPFFFHPSPIEKLRIVVTEEIKFTPLYRKHKLISVTISDVICNFNFFWGEGRHWSLCPVNWNRAIHQWSASQRDFYRALPPPPSTIPEFFPRLFMHMFKSNSA